MERKSSRPDTPSVVVPRRLAFDPTPAGVVTAPLHKAYKTVWTSICNAHKKGRSPICAICGTTYNKWKHIHGHEVYVYEPPVRVRLERIDFICVLCHDVIHYDRVRRRADAIYCEKLIQHYCRINGVSEDEFHSDFVATHHADVVTRQAFKPDFNLASIGGIPPLDYGLYQAQIDHFRARKAAGLTRRPPNVFDDDEDFDSLPDDKYPKGTPMWRDTFGH